jgi:voltage-gated potassium channel
MPRPAKSRFRFDQANSPWPTLMALVASIPAFYDSLLPMPAMWAMVMYVVSGLLVLFSAWQQGRRQSTKSRHTSSRWMPPPQSADWLLGAALLLCAALPPSSQSTGALSWRMTVALLTLLRLVLISRPLFERAGLARLLAMAIAVLGLCGIGFYMIDPEVTDLGQGLWLAFSTAATVGFGDVVPSNTASRIFSVFVVLLGYGVLSLVTASVAAMFVGSQERKVEREILHDMHAQLKLVRQEIATLRDSIEAAKAEARAASAAAITASAAAQGAVPTSAPTLDPHAEAVKPPVPEGSEQA